MRQSREAKAETHQAIIAAAARTFRERGIEGTSVGDVMSAANRTHGGFYRHFDSKVDLLVVSLRNAFEAMVDDLERALGDTPSREVLGGFLRAYTSPGHVTDVGGGCPAAALSNDVLRSTATVKSEFGQGVKAMIGAIAAHLEGPEAEREARAARTFAMAAGAVMIARASDPEIAALMLGAVRGETGPASDEG